MPMGPVQMLVLGFAEPNFTGKIAAELDYILHSENAQRTIAENYVGLPLDDAA